MLATASKLAVSRDLEIAFGGFIHQTAHDNLAKVSESVSITPSSASTDPLNIKSVIASQRRCSTTHQLPVALPIAAATTRMDAVARRAARWTDERPVVLARLFAVHPRHVACDESHTERWFSGRRNKDDAYLPNAFERRINPIESFSAVYRVYI